MDASSSRKRRRTSTAKYEEKWSASENSDNDSDPFGLKAEDSDDEDFDGGTKKKAKKRSGKSKDDTPATPKAQAKKRAQPNLKASITVLATDEAPWSSGADAAERLANIDSSILDRIKKALALASHENTGEQEAKQAMRMASKLMSQHSVTQADILAREDDAQKLKRAGMSVVSIRSTSSTPTVVRFETWADTVANAMHIFFDCQCYSTRFNYKVDWSFYGLAEQTVAAAYGFEMAYNMIQVWSLNNQAAKGLHGKNAYRRGVADGLRALARKEKNEEQQKAIEYERRRVEEEREREKEENERRLERLKDPDAKAEEQKDPDARAKAEKKSDRVESEGRVFMKEEEEEGSDEEAQAKDTKVKMEEVEDVDLRAPDTTTSSDPRVKPEFGLDSEFGGDPSDGVGEGSSDDDDDDYARPFDFDDDGPGPDFDEADESEGMLPPKTEDDDPQPGRSPSPPEFKPKVEPARSPSPQWQSASALTTFRQTSVAIGDEFLKSRKIKLSKGRSLPSLNLNGRDDKLIYRQGREDAKKIDVKRRRIREAEED